MPTCIEEKADEYISILVPVLHDRDNKLSKGILDERNTSESPELWAIVRIWFNMFSNEIVI